MQTVLIYRQTLLPASETFIKAQAGAVRGFDVRFAGLQPAQPSLELPTRPALLYNRRSLGSRVGVRFYNLTGFAPLFHRRIGSLKPSLIHAHFAPDGASAVHLSSRLNVPLVVTLHGYDVTTSDEHFAQTIVGREYLRGRQKLFERASLFICVSNFMRMKALEKGFPSNKLCVHYIGIDRDVFAPAQRPFGDQVLFVGRLVEKKGCRFLIQSMERVRQSIPSASLIIVGSGPLRQQLENEAKQAKLDCKFLGNQSPSSVRQLLRESALLCLPSITAADGDTEGLGMVLLEAQATGRPVVAFRTGGIPEALEEGLTGLLATPNDSTELAEHIVTLLANQELYRAASANSVHFIRSRFDLATQTAKLELIYNQLIADSK